MKIKTNIRAGAGSRNGGTCGGTRPFPLPHPPILLA
jgi:hypothetical protein